MNHRNEQHELSCEYYEPLISAKLDDELNELENEELTVHIVFGAAARWLVNSIRSFRETGDNKS